ncbi:hypothetical protein A2U01_0067589, partial [Trifolium medium]|nr:hypothetical protein [Trifolium medium]
MLDDTSADMGTAPEFFDWLFGSTTVRPPITSSPPPLSSFSHLEVITQRT